MAKRGPERRGRPSMGDRHAIMTRLPRPLANDVMELSDRLDLSYGETVRVLVEIAFRDGQLPDPAVGEQWNEESHRSPGAGLI